MIEKKIRETDDLITYSQMMIDFYNEVVIPNETDEKVKAQHALKVMQMETALDFNQAFITYMSQ